MAKVKIVAVRIYSIVEGDYIQTKTCNALIVEVLY